MKDQMAESGKKAAAEKAVDDFVFDGALLGIGSGTTIIYAVKRIAQKVKEEKIAVKCVPTSFQAKQAIIDNGLPLVTLEEYPILDVAIDGADEIDNDLIAIKGGGGCLLEEKIVDCAAKKFICVCDSRKDVNTLGTNWKNGIPIEVIPLAYKNVIRRIETAFGGKVELRMAAKKMGPVVTDHGNFIVDWKFERSLKWKEVDAQLHLIPGIVETGLFVNVISKAYFGDPSGCVKIRQI